MPDGSIRAWEPDPEALAASARGGLVEPAPAIRMPGLARKGRGAVSEPGIRFERTHAEAFDDGWAVPGAEPEALAPLDTVLVRDASRSAIVRNDSPDLGFDRAVNPYRGCEHGCIYCYARPSHAYLGYSPGLEFESHIVFKPGVAALLEKELSRPGYRVATLALGSNTDPYQPVERRLRLTRAVLEVLERFGHPVSIVTKSAGVVADLDLLRRLAARNLVRVFVSLTTLDPHLARIMEPRASSPALRLRAITALEQAGVPTGVMTAPMIPGLNDMEMERLLEAAHRAGAREAAYVLLRLPHELRGLFADWLAEHMPDRAARILALVRQTRNGALNDSRFGERFSGQGPYAELLSQRFGAARRRLGFTRQPPLETRHFASPAAAGAQLSLF